MLRRGSAPAAAPQRVTWRGVSISIHAPREGGDDAVRTKIVLGLISIHAPREGGDWFNWRKITTTVISIHAPREGGDEAVQPAPELTDHFNPRPPRGGRLLPSSFIAAISQISIHAPARGGDEITTRLDDILGISIHAPREGGDIFTIRRDMPK